MVRKREILKKGKSVVLGGGEEMTIGPKDNREGELRYWTCIKIRPSRKG